MSFKDIEIRYYGESNLDLNYSDIYEMALNESVRYDGYIGVLTQPTLDCVLSGLDVLERNDGVIRLVINPYLTKDDIDSVAREKIEMYDVIEKSLLNQYSFLKERVDRNKLKELSSAIEKKVLQIKVISSSNEFIQYERFGIFYDPIGNKIAFSGISNQNTNELSNQFEKINVFFQNNNTLPISNMEDDFERLWFNQVDGLEVVDLPNSIVKEIEQYVQNEQKTIKPRDYQLEAIKSLEDNDWHGLFEMATGTGKTITSLLATKRFLDQRKKMFLVVLVPYIHLVDQWVEVIRTFYDVGIIRCFDLKKSWKYILHQSVRDFDMGFNNLSIVVSTYKSANNEDFVNCIRKIKSNCFLIADECHNFGSREFRNIEFPKFEAALGLSATPDRWWDEKGTKHIYDFFGKVVFSYDLGMAISKGNLTNYIYEPIICSLNDEEIEKYNRITIQIIHCQKAKTIDYEKLKKLLLRRSAIINNCEDKLNRFFYDISKKKSSEVKNTLVYCPAGRIKEITIKLREMGFNAKNFDSSLTRSQREKTLREFANGEIQILTAMKCLDEGVDIPSTEVAYFLSSSSNPKEFIQRRGRILRLHKDKISAIIYDYLVLPADYEDILESIARKEMPRFAEFAEYATNKFVARSKVRNLLAEHSLEGLLDKFPWDVYKENLERNGMENDY